MGQLRALQAWLGVGSQAYGFLSIPGNRLVRKSSLTKGTRVSSDVRRRASVRSLNKR